MPRITSTKDLSQVNKQVGITDALQKQIDVLTERFKRVNTMVDDISSTHIPSFLNTIVFTWTGATGTSRVYYKQGKHKSTSYRRKYPWAPTQYLLLVGLEPSFTSNGSQGWG